MQSLKVILTVIGLLLIGFVAGFLTNRSIVKHHVHQARTLHQKGQFGDRLMDRIAATPTQREELKPILDQYGNRFRELRREHHHEKGMLHDSLHLELHQILTPEQQEEAQRWRRLFDGKKKRKKIDNQK